MTTQFPSRHARKKTLAFLKRDLPDTPRSTKLVAYKAALVPELEYRVLTWNTHQTSLINDCKTEPLDSYILPIHHQLALPLYKLTVALTSWSFYANVPPLILS